MERYIVHLDLDTFFVSVERLLNSKLMGLPVLVGGSSERGVVTSASYEARQYGVRSAMPMKQALRLCPHATVVKGDYTSYSHYSKMVTAILREHAPVVEKASIDEHYLDLTGMDKYFGCYKWAQELRQRIIRETGLPISFGMSCNKTVSKVATGQAKPNGKICVSAGTEKQFLAPLSLRKIPMVGEKAFQKLERLNITKVADVQRMDVDTMSKLFGDHGVSIWRKCNGICHSEVVPYHESKSLSTEQTFHQDTADVHFLRQTIIRMADELAYDLRKDKRLTGCVTVKIRYSNWSTYTQQAKISYSSATKSLTEKALQLFDRAFSQKKGSLRLIGVKFSDLVNTSLQTELFYDAVADINLCKAMDAIRSKFGFSSISKAASLH